MNHTLMNGWQDAVFWLIMLVMIALIGRERF